MRTTLTLLLILTTAVFLRFWQLDDLPPGWRDDELINSLVISQHAIDGDIRAFYPDASGHEGLYHILNAVPLYLFGPSATGIRALSAVMGSALVLFTFWLTRVMFGRDDVALTAAAALTVSFWGLMYSRIGLRHISLVFFVVPAFALLWHAIRKDQKLKIEGLKPSSRTLSSSLIFILQSSILLGLAFYTYFASRGVPLILLAWLAYLLLWNRPLLQVAWRPVWLVVLIGGLLAVPLMLTLQAQPEAQARVAELAYPVTELRQGNVRPLLEYTWITLGMFHATGDDEFLYNIPGRPLFNPLGAAFFWGGVVLAAWMSLRKEEWSIANGQWLKPEPAAFVLLWWLAGIAPAFLSVPPASLSHTILAQPATYMLVALPVGWLADWMSGRWPTLSRPAVAAGLGMLLVGTIALRDLPAYFVEWPNRGNTRFLYRADIHDVARALQAQPGDPLDIGMGSQLFGPWDRLAFAANLGAERPGVRDRWFNPERAVLLTPSQSWIGVPRTQQPFAPAAFRDVGPAAGGYRLVEIDPTAVPAFPSAVAPTCFVNGLCLTAQVEQVDGRYVVDLLVVVDSPLVLPDMPLVSNPAPPGVYSGPRLQLFAQLLDADGRFLAGDDAFGVDPQTLRVGDRFWQRHWLAAPADASPAVIAIGLYDPKTGERILTADGRDRLEIAP